MQEAICCIQVVDDLQWREALQAAGGPHNKAKLWPVAANGFQDLVMRKQEQVASALLCSCMQTPLRIAISQSAAFRWSGISHHTHLNTP